MMLKGQVEAYRTYKKELKKLGVQLEDWLELDAEAQEMKIEHAMKTKGM